MPRRRVGGVEKQVKADLDAVITAHPMGDALAEAALSAARRIDEADGLPVSGALLTGLSAMHNQLRAHLAELAKGVEGDDDGLAAALSVPTSIRD